MFCSLEIRKVVLIYARQLSSLECTVLLLLYSHKAMSQ